MTIFISVQSTIKPLILESLQKPKVGIKNFVRVKSYSHPSIMLYKCCCTKYLPSKIKDRFRSPLGHCVSDIQYNVIMYVGICLYLLEN